MLLTLAIILFIVWVVCVLAFKITFAIVHLLVILAVIAVVLHFYRKARATL
jgi:Flp pilus assembly protein TadB